MSACLLVVSACGGSTSQDAQADGIDATLDAANDAMIDALAEGATESGDVAARDAAPFDASQVAQTCSAYAETWCRRNFECTPGYMQRLYGTMDQCRAFARRRCETLLLVPGTDNTPSRIASCTTAIDAGTCDGLITFLADGFGVPSLASCEVRPGVLPQGASCRANAQCESLRCVSSTPDSLCGRCAPRGGDGSPCETSAECAPGRGCNSAGVCIRYREVDEPCSAAMPCRPRLLCSPASTCTDRVGSGQPCDTMNNNCDTYAGLACSRMTGTCSPYDFAPEGQPCGLVRGVFTVCGAGARCRITDSRLIAGTCFAQVADGMPCQFDEGPNGSQCATGSACLMGTCRFATQMDCR